MILTSMRQVIWCIADSIDIMSTVNVQICAMCSLKPMSKNKQTNTRKHCSARTLLIVKTAAKR